MVSLVQQGLGWVPTACNLVALLAFGLCLSLNAHLTDVSDLSILAIAPLLLLLTQVLSALLNVQARCMHSKVCSGHLAADVVACC